MTVTLWLAYEMTANEEVLQLSEGVELVLDTMAFESVLDVTVSDSVLIIMFSDIGLDDVVSDSKDEVDPILTPEDVKGSCLPELVQAVAQRSFPVVHFEIR